MKTKHIFICGAKSIGQYGGYETFIDKLTEQHAENSNIKYHIVTKANGSGFMDESQLDGVVGKGDNTFIYHNADVVKIKVPQIGSAQAIIYDVLALRYCIQYCEEHKIKNPVFYVLACRIGLFVSSISRKIHKIGGVLYVNPDGHEWMRQKWNKLIRVYWKWSEKKMIKHADLLICDSVNIEKYIKKEYHKYNPETTYIAYGADMEKSVLKDDAPEFMDWLAANELECGQYYMCCGRFVPENSYETMIREFMKSHSKRTFIIITKTDDKYYNEIKQKLRFDQDARIKFVGTVYNSELLKKIRENAFANFHGHTVGGTNPSLLEALESTDVNLLIDVKFNQEVARDAALYWNDEEGNLSQLIDRTDEMGSNERKVLGDKAKARIKKAYSWKLIGDQYEKLWME